MDENILEYEKTGRIKLEKSHEGLMKMVGDDFLLKELAERSMKDIEELFEYCMKFMKEFPTNHKSPTGADLASELKMAMMIAITFMIHDPDKLFMFVEFGNQLVKMNFDKEVKNNEIINGCVEKLVAELG